MQLFASYIRAVGVVLALFIAISVVSAMPPAIDVVARDAAVPLNHDENNMLKRQDTTIMLKRQETSMLKRQENDMLKRQENDMLKRQENDML